MPVRGGEGKGKPNAMATNLDLFLDQEKKNATARHFRGKWQILSKDCR